MAGRTDGNKAAGFCPAVRLIGQGMRKEDLARLISSHWSIPILKILYDNGSMRYSALREATGLNPKVLAGSLRELARLRFIVKRTVSVKPMEVSYSITRKGETVISSGCPFFLA